MLYAVCRTSGKIHAHRDQQEELVSHAAADADAAAKEHAGALRAECCTLDAKESALQSALADFAHTQALLAARDVEGESRRTGEMHSSAPFSLELEVDRLKRHLKRVEAERESRRRKRRRGGGGALRGQAERHVQAARHAVEADRQVREGVKGYAAVKSDWRHKLSAKKREVEALKITNGELALAAQLAGTCKPGQPDPMEVRSLNTCAANAERRLNNAQNQLLATEGKVAAVSQKSAATDAKWGARVREYEAHLRAAEERVKREGQGQGGEERVAELENLKGLQRQFHLAQKRLRVVVCVAYVQRALERAGVPGGFGCALATLVPPPALVHGTGLSDAAKAECEVLVRPTLATGLGA
ncbi:hypothetical protein FB451DRAFT_1175029 [Mycena latifolia]|nr:hypothetical protein FB451DRAFT_1175029 [Mycena latifolia]